MVDGRQHDLKIEKEERETESMPPDGAQIYLQSWNPEEESRHRFALNNGTLYTHFIKKCILKGMMIIS